MAGKIEIKICGIRRIEDIELVNRYKPDYIGFILAKGYKRTISPQAAAVLKDRLADGIKTVGVFVNSPVEEVEEFQRIAGLDAVQLHGDENEAYIEKLNVPCEIWQVVRVRGGCDIADVKGADKILLDKYDADRYGGTGEVFDAAELGSVKASVPIILAGGLSAENVTERVKLFRPDGVDVSSAVETDGFKDEQKIKEFIDIVRMI
ncbi:MAG: phosphoribosylanthranilate isomerase [bacterium]|nr:phosphoribosylanthranilate isomerase [bacterium]